MSTQTDANNHRQTPFWTPWFALPEGVVPFGLPLPRVWFLLGEDREPFPFPVDKRLCTGVVFHSALFSSRALTLRRPL